MRWPMMALMSVLLLGCDTGVGRYQIAGEEFPMFIDTKTGCVWLLQPKGRPIREVQFKLGVSVEGLHEAILEPRFVFVPQGEGEEKAIGPPVLKGIQGCP